MKYIIFSFMMGDYLLDHDGKIKVFETEGIAIQYLVQNFRTKEAREEDQKEGKKKTEVKQYQAPFVIKRAV